MSKKPIIAEAVGHAGGTGAELGRRIEEAMGAAVLACNELGIADDTPPERVEELLGAAYAGKDGATVIREAKIEARGEAKAAYRAEQEAAAAAANAAD